ncbi:MAG TPA: glycosyltransferase family 9 protein [Dehalococcoidia bacterium]|nr:glycosyltransferase family 9 protein [Dehalococcoidia bacterium]
MDPADRDATKVALATQILSKPGSRVLVLRALQIGDLLCAVPALRALRGRFPEVEISLIGIPWARDFVRRFRAYTDRFLLFPGYPGIPEAPFVPDATLRFFAWAQSQHYDLAIQLHGNGLRTNAFVEMLGAEATSGFFLPGQPAPDSLLFFPYPGAGSEIHRLLSLAEGLGASRSDDLEFPLEAADWAEFEALRKRVGLMEGEYVCLHVGARDPRRRWPAERFAQVADGLASRGLRVVFTGTADEAPMVDAVVEQMSSPSLSLAGQTTLGGLACLIDRAALLVAGDTGVSHIAAARGTRSVIIFTFSDPDRWAPLDAQLHRVLVAETARRTSCGDGLARCLMDGCNAADGSEAHPHQVEPEEVLAQADVLLSKGVGLGVA